MSNHESNLDPPVLISGIPIPAVFLAKKEVKWMVPVGWAAMMAGTIFIDRSNRERAINSLHRAAPEIRGGKSVVIFPEGTRTRTGELLPFKKGGFVMAEEAGVQHRAPGHGGRPTDAAPRRGADPPGPLRHGLRRAGGPQGLPHPGRPHGRGADPGGGPAGTSEPDRGLSHGWVSRFRRVNDTGRGEERENLRRGRCRRRGRRRGADGADGGGGAGRGPGFPETHVLLGLLHELLCSFSRRSGIICLRSGSLTLAKSDSCLGLRDSTSIRW